jgi:hypothetical protein
MKSGPKLSHFPSYLDRFPPSIGIGIHQETVHRKSLIKGDMSICLSLPPRERVVLRSLPSVSFLQFSNSPSSGYTALAGTYPSDPSYDLSCPRIRYRHPRGIALQDNRTDLCPLLLLR